MKKDYFKKVIIRFIINMYKKYNIQGILDFYRNIQIVLNINYIVRKVFFVLIFF